MLCIRYEYKIFETTRLIYQYVRLHGSEEIGRGIYVTTTQFNTTHEVTFA